MADWLGTFKLNMITDISVFKEVRRYIKQLLNARVLTPQSKATNLVYTSHISDIIQLYL